MLRLAPIRWILDASLPYITQHYIHVYNECIKLICYTTRLTSLRYIIYVLFMCYICVIYYYIPLRNVYLVLEPRSIPYRKKTVYSQQTNYIGGVIARLNCLDGSISLR